MNFLGYSIFLSILSVIVIEIKQIEIWRDKFGE